ncbi:MAG: hypothetical protein AAF490_19635 [Chloroflexota bacterium]
MMAEFLKIAQLEQEGVQQLKSLETTFGVHLMAYEAGLSIAELSKDQMEAIKTLEEKLGVVILAFDN